MQTLKDYILFTLLVLAVIAVCSYDDGYEEKQNAADEIKAAQLQSKIEAAQAKRELKARQAMAGHMLDLDRIR